MLTNHRRHRRRIRAPTALTHTATVPPRFRQMATEGGRHAKIETNGVNLNARSGSGDRRAGNHIRRVKEFARLISEILNNSWQQTRAREF